MTDRINGFWVAPAEDTRIDDAEATIAAVLQIKGVIRVEPNVADSEDWLARTRVRYELHARLLEVLK
jgi:hypothetical protein